MVSNQFYGLKTIAEANGEPAIFIAPSSDGATWQEKDHALFDDLLAFAKENLCFDTSRVFATGFSFGGMITYSLSTNHQRDIRAAVGIAPAKDKPSTHRSGYRVPRYVCAPPARPATRRVDGHHGFTTVLGAAASKLQP